MNIAIYSRKSKFTGQGESVENQITICREYIEKHFEKAEINVYEDEGFSGGDTDRPQFQRLIKEARAKRFDVLICYRLDRISRNISNFARTIEMLENNNISFVSVKEQFDTATPMGRAMLYIASVFAQLERETIAERIRDNMLQLARTGRWLGGNTPTGFESESIIYMDTAMKEKKMFKLSPIDEELTLVTLLFDKYLEFKSLSKLETYLIQNDLTTKTGKCFQKHSLRTILTNPVYAQTDGALYAYFSSNGAQIANEKSEWTGQHGAMVYNKNLVKKGKSVKRKDMSEWIVAIGKHKGIIDGREWIQVQHMMHINKDKAPRQGTSHTALLSGLIRCAGCGSFMGIKYGQVSKETGKRIYYYVCNNKNISRGVKCKCPNLQGMKVDKGIMEELKVLLANDVLKSLDQYNVNINTKKLEVKELQNKIHNKHKAIDNLVKQLSKSDDEFVSDYILNEIKRLIQANKVLSQELENDHKEIQLLNIDLLKMPSVGFSEIVDGTLYESKRNFINGIIEKIVWDGESLDIHLLNI
ncbi:Resolvase, N-terminal domain [Alkaliphilus metalliredigens QYMF]|uniref:Resolvase, N-terminal domain n=1 Tax=Alkaliphilus metalliredigens (strain QYMF) TaxID=293826 RepID=A6TR11_ALKMQ|nr:recombinase family protein [Alkaliphilus metalliredigens]ABR48629.1 Resolvase, N-terminal domain [Alkaliphilus metalliredigens QYMF]